MADASRNLELILRLKDDASKALKNVSSNFDGIAKKASDVGKKMSLMGAGAVAAGSVFVKSAQEQIRVEKQLDAVLKSTGGAAGISADEIKKMASALQKTTNFGDEAIINGQNLMLTFTNIGKDVFPSATETMLDMSAALGQDMKSSAVQLGKALNDPIAGVSALSKVGVNFTEDQKAVIASLVETGDVAGAQKVILAELGKEFGGSAEAIADPLTQMKNQLGDVGEQIGTALLPALESLVGWITPIVEKFQAWVAANPELAEKIGLVVAIIVGLMVVIGPLLVILPMIVSAVGLVGAAFMFLISPIGLVIVAVVALAVLIVKNWDWIKEKTVAVFTAIGEFFKKTWDTIKNVFNTIVQAIIDSFTAKFEFWRMLFETVMNAILMIWTTIWTAVSEFVATAWEAIKGLVSAGLTALSGLISGATGAVTGAFNNIWESVKGAASSGMEAVKGVVIGAINWVITKLNGFISKVNSVASKAADIVGLSAPQISKIPHLAKGGIVTGPTTALIGEAGPEAVIPLDKMGSMGTTVNIVVNGDISGEDLIEKVSEGIMNSLRMNQRLPI